MKHKFLVCYPKCLKRLTMILVTFGLLLQAPCPALCEDDVPELPDIAPSDSIEGGLAPLFPGGGNADLGGLFGGGGGGGGLFGGGGGGPFNARNGQQLLSQVAFLQALFALFQGSNTQQSAGSAVQNLRNADSKTSSTTSGGASSNPKVPPSGTSGGGNNTTSVDEETPTTGAPATKPTSSPTLPTEPQHSPQDPSSNSGTANETITPSNPSTTTPNGNELPTGAFFQRNFANE